VGIVVVAAAGNRGVGSEGTTQYGGITSPGNAPWVLTVGAASDRGTVERADDIVAGFSSRGPAAIDRGAKPDVVAHGVAIESTSETSSALFAANVTAPGLGAGKTAPEPYMTLTGTSMAAPVVTGAIALMLEANPALTPNAVKAILQFTAEARPGVDHLTQGAGFLNARGAVALARVFAGVSAPGEAASDPVPWSRHIIWGNRRIAGAMLSARANAWALGVTWGDTASPEGDAIDWGLSCAATGCGLSVVPACDASDPDCLEGRPE
jgi:subtilisin family serine protease